MSLSIRTTLAEIKAVRLNAHRVIRESNHLPTLTNADSVLRCAEAAEIALERFINATVGGERRINCLSPREEF